MHSTDRRAKLARRAARAAMLQPTGPNPHRSTGMYMGPLTPVSPAGFSGRKGRRPGADKGQRGWNNSPYYVNAVTVDSRWSKTVSDNTDR